MFEKKIKVFLLTLILMGSMLSFVSAANPNPPTSPPATSTTNNALQPVVNLIKGIVQGVYEVLEPVLKYLIGETDSSSKLFLAKILFLFIIIGIVYAVLSNIDFFDDSPWVLWIVSFAVGFLGIRFLTPEVVNTIIMPYSAVAVAITAGLPFVIYFMLMLRFGAAHAWWRKIGWIFFAVVFLGIYSMRQTETPFAWIYTLTAILAIVMALIDGLIQQWLANARQARLTAAGKGKAYGALMKSLNDASTDFGKDPGTYEAGYDPAALASKLAGPQAYRADVKFLKKAIKHL